MRLAMRFTTVWVKLMARAYVRVHEMPQRKMCADKSWDRVGNRHLQSRLHRVEPSRQLGALQSQLPGTLLGNGDDCRAVEIERHERVC